MTIRPNINTKQMIYNVYKYPNIAKQIISGYINSLDREVQEGTAERIKMFARDELGVEL